MGGDLICLIFILGEEKTARPGFFATGTDTPSNSPHPQHHTTCAICETCISLTDPILLDLIPDPDPFEKLNLIPRSDPLAFLDCQSI
jgi:hypothetical protein